MLSNLAEKLQKALRSLRGKGKLTEKDVDLAMREIRLALLEADVNFKVVKDFVASIRERAVGHEVMQSLTPGQQVVKIVHEELTRLMGQEQSRLASGSPPTTIMLVGLQGSGKTTSAIKLAHYLRRHGHRPLLAAADIYRPGAIQQLEILSRSAGIPFYSDANAKPLQICEEAVKESKREGYDYVILDTAGRLHLDEIMMAELQEIRDRIRPQEILLVVDAMTGQDAVNAAAAFHQAIGLSGGDPDQAGRGYPGRGRSLRAGCDRLPHQVCGGRGEDRRPGALPPGADGLPDSGHGRRPLPHREGGGQPRPGQGPGVGGEAAAPAVYPG